MVYYLLAAGITLALVGLYLLLRKYIHATDEGKSWILKGFSLGFAVFFALRYLSGEIALVSTRGLNIHSPFGTDDRAIALTVFSLFCVWATFAAYALLATYPFFKGKVKTLTPLVKYFATVVYLIDLITFSVQLTALGGKNDGSLTLKGVFFALEVGAALAICAAVWLQDHKVRFSRKGLWKGLTITLCMMAASLPVFALQVLFDVGSVRVVLKDFTVEHRLVLYGAFILPAILILTLNRFDLHHRRYALLYLSIATMTSYSFKYSFDTFTDMTSWPLHLCNTAMYIIPLCLMFKLNKVFYFTLFINVLGAFLAMALPNYDSNVYWRSARCVEFWINHYCAFFMPIAIIATGLYERPKMKLFTYSLVGFFAYYAVVLFANAWLTNIDPGIDFFFINSNFIAEKLGTWAERLRDIVWTFHPKKGISLIFYPVYQALYFLVYVGLSFAMWFLYELCFQTADLYADIWRRNKKIRADRLALQVSRAEKRKAVAFDMEGTNKLILKNFSKKYATSDVYAVHDANLEIEGGQIFGFLGPNGAGKSTIIKSIVGIQGITSGNIEVCGYDVEKQSVEAKLQIGFVPDHYALYENLTGREYVNYIADLYNVNKEERCKRIEDYVDRFCLHGSFDNPIKTYSHGMKQKITIMSALVHNPKLWILDEPLTGLDPESIFQVKEAMKQHAKEGNIVFFSSHIIDVVERICDQIAIIKKGQILCQRKVAELEAEGKQLEEFYMGMIEGANDEAVAANE
ncbi:MAG: YwaF family protein [Clostridia bacterium]|nr:YwaF family protein [Clostridia bacterium]